MSDPLQTVVGALERAGCGPKESAGSIVARCPAHDDRGPSLRVDPGVGGRVLLCCFAGCQTENIIRALGLEWRDLFPANSRHNRRRGSATRKRPADVLLELLRERGIAYACTSSPKMWVVDDCPVCHAGKRWPLWLFEEEDGRVGASCCNGCDQDDVFDVITGRAAGREAA